MVGRGQHTCVYSTRTSRSVTSSVLLRQAVHQPVFNFFTVGVELPWVPSGDACSSYEIGIHRCHPACCGARMLLKPRELDYCRWQAAQTSPPARATHGPREIRRIRDEMIEFVKVY
jgi:hypothetical protein